MKKLLVTRPTLAARLLNAGNAGELTIHPFDTTKSAWLFDTTQDTVAIAKNYYAEIGAPLPKSLTDERQGDSAQ